MKTAKLSFWSLLKNPPGSVIRMFEHAGKLGDIVKLPGIMKRYMINHPDAVSHVLMSNRQNYIKAGTDYDRITEVLGHGLLTNDGDAWSERRKQCAPYFYQKHLQAWIPTMQQMIDNELDHWTHDIEQQKAIDISHEMMSIILKVSAKVLFGITYNKEQADYFVRLVNIGNQYAAKTSCLHPAYPSPRNLYYRFHKHFFDKFLLIPFAKEEDTHIHPTPLLQPLVDDYHQGKLSPNIFLGELKNALISGHETTGTSLAWTFYCLANHPDHFQTIKEEVGTHCTDLNKLIYTEAAIKESMRLYPPIWLIQRKACSDDTIQGVTIKQNSHVLMCTHFLHRHPNYWTQANTFMPTRFIDKTLAHKHVYLPFGTGARVCIGSQLAMMMAKMLVASVAGRFNLSPTKTKINAMPLITLRAEKTLKILLHKNTASSH